jgi:hypothetical protein
MAEVGFSDIAFLGVTGFRTSQFTVGALFRGLKT